jgi:tripartite-type tricarboxylate transporter receptor subunit TctC
MDKIRVLIISLVTMAVPAAALAQGSADTYPSRPVTIITPFAPGGPTDSEGRLYTQRLTDSLGHPFVLEAKPGAGTTIGLGHVVKAAPDGYTLLLMTASLSVVPLLHKDLPYDLYASLAPISLMSKRNAVLAVHPSLPIKNMTEFVAYAKANPGKLNYSTVGAGGGQHLTGVWLESVSNTKLTMVHYKGTGAAMPDLLAGRAHLTFLTFTTALPLAKAGKVRIIAQANLERAPSMPDVPTLVEAGYEGFEYSSWLGMLAPARTPAAIINKLNAELVKIARSPDLIKRTAAEIRLIGSSPEEFRRYILTEHERWKKLVRDNNIQFE